MNTPNTKSTTTVVTPTFTASYPHLFQPRRNDLSGKDEYSVVALFAAGVDLGDLKKAAQAAIESRWGTDRSKWPKSLRTPFRRHEERATPSEAGVLVFPEGMMAGGVFVNLKTQQLPGIVDHRVQPVLDPVDVYAGCKMRASIRAFGYDHKGNRGVAFALVNLQKVGDGPPLSGRSTPEQDFQPVPAAAGPNGGESADTTDDLFA